MVQIHCVSKKKDRISSRGNVSMSLPSPDTPHQSTRPRPRPPAHTYSGLYSTHDSRDGESQRRACNLDSPFLYNY
ncbi:hypothetical protein MUK42_31263 [Musa troglodytarum]|uniref:Uncharacterized protein n=1 Tax=Musa troglodytarum TaxID=320322 RepID=A0A9E7FN12_9LILI|nr:hypothetical protein MUK42_31263 [Musa troglodytarum]